jgi:hypothetical protein
LLLMYVAFYGQTMDGLLQRVGGRQLHLSSEITAPELLPEGASGRLAIVGLDLDKETIF